MKIRLLYWILLGLIIFSSCKNYKRELHVILNNLENSGIQILDTNMECHTVIYNDNGTIMANNVDTSWVVLSPLSNTYTYSYYLGANTNGGIDVKLKKVKIDLLKSTIYHTAKIKLDENKNFSHVLIDLSFRNIDSIDKETSSYSFNSNFSDILVPKLPTVKLKDEFDTGKETNEYYYLNKWHKVSENGLNLCNILEVNLEKLYPFYMEKEQTGEITAYFTINDFGAVENLAEYIKYSNSYYDLYYKFPLIKTTSNASDFFYNINEFMLEVSKQRALAQEKMIIEEKKKEFINIEDLHDMYVDNAARTDMIYKGKRIKITCKIERMENNNNLLLYTNYNYKLNSKNSFLWGGFNIDAYTNDENFININFPTQIYMDAILVLRDGVDYIFRDCNLYFAE